MLATPGIDNVELDGPMTRFRIRELFCSRIDREISVQQGFCEEASNTFIWGLPVMAGLPCNQLFLPYNPH